MGGARTGESAVRRGGGTYPRMAREEADSAFIVISLTAASHTIQTRNSTVTRTKLNRCRMRMVTTIALSAAFRWGGKFDSRLHATGGELFLGRYSIALLAGRW